jgi:hypothetical protein
LRGSFSLNCPVEVLAIPTLGHSHAGDAAWMLLSHSQGILSWPTRGLA